MVPAILSGGNYAVDVNDNGLVLAGSSGHAFLDFLNRDMGIPCLGNAFRGA